MKKDFQVKTHDAQWAKKRDIVRIEHRRAIEAIDEDLNFEIKKIKDEAEEKIRNLKYQASEQRLNETLKMHDRLAEIAAEQDAFEDEFRNYVETLPRPEDE